jgi:bifunctional non-homologous end joining protein LigD
VTPTRPRFVVPMAAHSVDKLPEGADWLYELKWDGYRALLIKDGARVEIRSRNDKDLTQMYPDIVAAGGRLEARQAVIDGEIVALDAAGKPSFQALQHRDTAPKRTIVFYAFDVLHVDGRDTMDEPLTGRRSKLATMIGNDSAVRFSQDLPGSPQDVVRALLGAGIEGVIAKRKDSSYQPGERCGNWLKLKLEQQQEFVIGGYRPDGGGFDALLVGYYQGKALQFAGKVRAGIVPYVRRELAAKLKPLHSSGCPFANLPDASRGRWGGGVTAEDMHEMRWTKPQLVAQIKFVEWTADGRLRHAVFLGLRNDKPAAKVVRESS